MSDKNDMVSANDPNKEIDKSTETEIAHENLRKSKEYADKAQIEANKAQEIAAKEKIELEDMIKLKEHADKAKEYAEKAKEYANYVLNR